PGAAPAPPATAGQPGGAPQGPPAPAPGAPGTNPPAPQLNNAAVKPPGFSVVAGYGCGSSAAQSFSEHDRYGGGATGWVAVGKGGWASDGCNGSFDTMPMSGSATSADSGIYAVWSFSPGTAGLTRATCQVQLYVPADHDPTHVGGDPAHFQVYGSGDASGSMTSDFNVDQFGYLGQWKPVGTFAVTKGTLSIKLDNRGLDWHSSTVTNAHLAVAQFRANCA
ncbi:hypothetical protein ACFW1A_19575, partial [Kitasatospora sp. NPDC058965]